MNVVLLLSDQEDSNAALDWALDYIRTNTAAALHVVPAAADAPAVPAHLSPGYREDLKKRLDDANIQFTLHESGADPGHKVVRLVDELPAELAVVGLRKRTLAYKMVMGSHARHVIQQAGCPVVTVKAHTT